STMSRAAACSFCTSVSMSLDSCGSGVGADFVLAGFASGWRSGAESRSLIDALCRPFELLEHQVRFRWEPDSVAFWDNRAVQHYACSDYWPDVRVMERVSIVGSRPVRRS
ncbi:MAG TPA: TauD/TfdA family dioxygenase, partial [Microthrixaceae bacterium]|nr:TauD/TfdA family dioxygenase [Microthrixaceae bacterium]